MSFEVDRYSSAWAHIALCADLTWVAEPPDEFIRANQRLWTQHCRITQALQDTFDLSRSHDRITTSKRELADKPPSSDQNQEDANYNGRISVKDVIPESRLSHYGNFFYDESREKCYVNGYEQTSSRGNSHGSDNNDVTECWMLPEFQFDTPRPLTDSQRSNRLAIQSLIRNSRNLQTYRGTNISRYTPTSRPVKPPDKRCGFWCPKDHVSPKIDTRNSRFKVGQNKEASKKTELSEVYEKPNEEAREEENKTGRVVVDDQTPSTSAAAIESSLRKRLYSTVLSGPSPITINQAALRLTQKLLAPGLLKLNPKIVLPSARIRPVVETKFEELEKEALEQYKASDESIDTKFKELEKQAVEQYSTSNSNTSCSSGNSAEKQTTSSPTIPEGEAANFSKAVDSVVIFSQNFPDLNAGKTTTSGTNLKNLKTPPRVEKREQAHRLCKARVKGETLNTASDTDDGGKKSGIRRSMHAVPPKKRHLSLCVSDVSSDEEVTIKNACMKDLAIGTAKMSAHGGGDLNPLRRKT